MCVCVCVGGGGSIIKEWLGHEVPGIWQKGSTLAGVTQWTERQPAKQRLAGSVASQGCGPGPQLGHAKGNHT